MADAAPNIAPPPPPPPKGATAPVRAAEPGGKRKVGRPKKEPQAPALTPEEQAQIAAMFQAGAEGVGALCEGLCVKFLHRQPRPGDPVKVGAATMGLLAVYFPEMDEKDRAWLLLAAALGAMVANAEPIPKPEPLPDTTAG